jgi:hypothetical protein
MEMGSDYWALATDYFSHGFILPHVIRFQLQNPKFKVQKPNRV